MDAKAVLDHHVSAFLAGDAGPILDDYADDAVLILPEATVKGREAIAGVYADLLSGLFAPGTFEFTVDRKAVEGDVAYLVWHATCAGADIPFASDTYVVRDGKIAVQTVALKVEPK